MEKLKIVVDDKGRTTVWMNGEIVQGIRRIEFDHEIGCIPEHIITFSTQAGGVGNER